MSVARGRDTHSSQWHCTWKKKEQINEENGILSRDLSTPPKAQLICNSETD